MHVSSCWKNVCIKAIQSTNPTKLCSPKKIVPFGPGIHLMPVYHGSPHSSPSENSEFLMLHPNHLPTSQQKKISSRFQRDFREFPVIRALSDVQLWFFFRVCFVVNPFFEASWGDVVVSIPWIYPPSMDAIARHQDDITQILDRKIST